MTVFSKRTVLILLAAFVLLSIALRYPILDHERYQADSYFVHRLSQSILDEGRAMWTFNPLSYVGYYPFSYPSGAPFLIADISSMTGLSVELSVLVLGMSLGLIMCLGAFCLAREFLHGSPLVLLATLLVITGSRFVDTTYWVGSARGILVVIMILSILAAFRGSTMGNNRLLFIAALMGVCCFSLHHMALLYVFFGFALVMTSGVSGYIRRLMSVRRRRLSNAVYIALACSIAAVSFGYISAFVRALDQSFTETSLFDLEPASVSIVLNMAASYTNQIGFILPIAVLGIPYFIRRAPLSPKNMYPFAVLITFVPLLGLSLYISMLIAPFVVILGVCWVGSWFASARRRAKVFSAALVVLLAASSILLPVWSVDRWNGKTYVTGDAVEVSHQMVCDATYLEYSLLEGAFVISNSMVYSSQMASITNAPVLGSGVGAVLAGDIDAEDLAGNVSLFVKEFPPDIYRLLRYDREVSIDNNIYSLMIQGVHYGRSSTYFESHSTLVVIIDNNWPSTLVAQYFSRAAELPGELKDAAWDDPSSEDSRSLPSYMVYLSARVSLYYVALP